MASYNELSFDWNILFENYDHWTKRDLQLAAELGKTLLERNKELENTLKHHQSTVEDQAQEIVYLQKQTVALREVNDSRLKIYEQLEIGIQDLERANHRLLVENSGDKKHIKTLLHNIENLETRTEELSKTLDEVKKELTFERRKNERLQHEKNKSANEVQGVRLRHRQDDEPESNESQIDGAFEPNGTLPENCSFVFQSQHSSGNANSTEIDVCGTSSLQESLTEDTEEFVRVYCDLETTKKALTSEKQKVAELEEQLVAIIQENQKLQSRLAHSNSNDEMKSVHDELSILDEVRQGQMCTRCLRFVDDRFTMNDDASSIAPTEDDDDRSLMELENNMSEEIIPPPSSLYRSAVTIKDLPRAPDSLDLNVPASPNLYRDLVEKYEALLKVQRHTTAHKTGMSLAEEFQSSGEYNSLNIKDQGKLQLDTGAHSNDGGSSCNGSMTNENVGQIGNNKNNRRTPTDFSEAETSSSGFSDETSNKGTQTDDRPGFFLCSIGDGEDCKFSIYDDASPIDSRFRNRPEYRELFKEIFAVLRKAAENKEEGEKLPLLDDTHPVVANKVPPVTPANEELPDFGDDTQSIISSAISEQSFAMSECITKMERKTAKKHITEKNQENKPPSTPSTASASVQSAAANEKQIIENGRVLTPLKREPLEYLSVGVGIKKKNRKKNRNFNNDRSDSPILPSPPRIYYSSNKKGRRSDMRPFNAFTSPSSPLTGTTPKSSNQPKYEWNGNSMIIYNRNTPNHSSRDMNTSGIEYRPSTVSQDLHKLRKLDLSYSEVLRRADVTCKHSHPRKH